MAEHQQVVKRLMIGTGPSAGANNPSRLAIHTCPTFRDLPVEGQKAKLWSGASGTFTGTVWVPIR